MNRLVIRSTLPKELWGYDRGVSCSILHPVMLSKTAGE